MKKRLVAVILGLLLVSANAAVLDGTWRVDQPRHGGVTLHTYLVLRQKGTELDGKVVINGSVDLPLRNPRLEGSDAAFSVDWGTEYRVHPEGDKLRVTIIWGAKDREEALRRDPSLKPRIEKMFAESGLTLKIETAPLARYALYTGLAAGAGIVSAFFAPVTALAALAGLHLLGPQ